MPKKNFNASVLPKMRAFTAKLLGRKDCVLVGLSGGADSVCLLHFLQYLAKEKHFALAAVHVNHGLRGRAANADERFCKNLCKELDIPLFVKKVNARAVAKKQDLSPEHGARKARYKAYEQVAKKWGATKLALGHHADDQAETFLLNLLRGTKAQGLAGIPLRRPLCAGTCRLISDRLCRARPFVRRQYRRGARGACPRQSLRRRKRRLSFRAEFYRKPPPRAPPRQSRSFASAEALSARPFHLSVLLPSARGSAHGHSARRACVQARP